MHTATHETMFTMPITHQLILQRKTSNTRALSQPLIRLTVL